MLFLQKNVRLAYAMVLTTKSQENCTMYWVVSVNLSQTQEERLAAEELPSLDGSVGMSVRSIFLDW